jgi:hypothetical protein
LHLNLGCPPICLRRFGYVLSILRGGPGRNRRIKKSSNWPSTTTKPTSLHTSAASARRNDALRRLLRCSPVNKYSSSSCRRCCLVITAAACRHRRRDWGASCTAKVLATVNEDIVTTVPSITRIIVARTQTVCDMQTQLQCVTVYCNRNGDHRWPKLDCSHWQLQATEGKPAPLKHPRINWLTWCADRKMRPGADIWGAATRRVKGEKPNATGSISGLGN